MHDIGINGDGNGGFNHFHGFAACIIAHDTVIIIVAKIRLFICQQLGKGIILTFNHRAQTIDTPFCELQRLIIIPQIDIYFTILSLLGCRWGPTELVMRNIFSSCSYLYNSLVFC